MSWTTRVKPSRMILDPFRVVGPLRTMGNSGRLTITEVVSRYGGEVLVMFELHGLMGKLAVWRTTTSFERGLWQRLNMATWGDNRISTTLYFHFSMSFPLYSNPLYFVFWCISGCSLVDVLLRRSCSCFIPPWFHVCLGDFRFKRVCCKTQPRVSKPI